MLRAVVEGLAYELARYLRFLLDAGIRLDRLIMTGKASASRVTPQILADVTGLPIACTVNSEASALGAAIIARGLIEPGVPLDQIAESMTLPSRLVSPGKDAAAYQAACQQYLASLPWRQSTSARRRGESEHGVEDRNRTTPRCSPALGPGGGTSRWIAPW